MLAIYVALPTPVSCVSSNLMPTSGVCKREKFPFDFLDGLRLAADANACSSQASMWVHVGVYVDEDDGSFFLPSGHVIL